MVTKVGAQNFGYQTGFVPDWYLSQEMSLGTSCCYTNQIPSCADSGN